MIQIEKAYPRDAEPIIPPDLREKPRRPVNSNVRSLDVDTFEALKSENAELRERVAILEKEVGFLRTHPSIAQGLKGETLAVCLSGGVATKFAEKYDLVVNNEIKVEVKFSKLNTPVAGSSTKRWNWSKPLGWKDKGKDYDFLLLIGERDARYPDQYVDDSPYVFFLVPRQKVPEITNSGATIGGNVQITTKLSGFSRSQTSRTILEHMVSQADVSALLSNAKAI